LKDLPRAIFRLCRTVFKNGQWGKHCPIFRFVQKEYQPGGIGAAEASINREYSTPKHRAKALQALSKLCLEESTADSIRLGKLATELSPGTKSTQWLGLLLFDAGEIRGAYQLLKGKGIGRFAKPSWKRKWNHIQGCHTLLRSGIKIPGKRPGKHTKNPKSIMYVVWSSLPYHTTGYTVRTQGLLKAITALGWEIHCVTRPGYPDDREDALLTNAGNPCDSLGYPFSTLGGNHRRDVPLDVYFKESAEIIAQKAVETGASIIHAASNYEVGLPSLMAARMLGIPFIYEVRGLWEYSTAAKIRGWEKTERFGLDSSLENLVATQADHVFTLTEALSEELQHRGVKKSKVGLLPNGADLTSALKGQWKQADTNANFGPRKEIKRIAYIGSIEKYEGLDDLIHAFSSLVKERQLLELMVIGDGGELPRVKKLAISLGLQGKVAFKGRIPHREIPEYYKMVDLLVLPRKPCKVCNLVSPLKPIEAMAHQVPILVSNVRPLMDIIQCGKYGHFFQAGDRSDLENSLRKVLEETFSAVQKANNVFSYMTREHSWDTIAREAVNQYEIFLGNL
jgi:glycosyltransferase involved in cell wall biosynthesis